MDNDDVRQPELDRDGTKELLKSFDAPSRSADAADGYLGKPPGVGRMGPCSIGHNLAALVFAPDANVHDITIAIGENRSQCVGPVCAVRAMATPI